MQWLSFFKDKNTVAKSFNYAVPAIGERLLLLMITMINTAFAGHLGNTDAFTAICICTSIMNIVQYSLMGLSLGAAVSASHSCGREQDTKVAAISVHSMMICLAVGLFYSLLLLLFRTHIVRLLFAASGAAVHKSAETYLLITLFVIPLNAVELSISSVMRGCGNFKLPFNLTLTANLLGILSGYVFMFPMQMGVRGAAYAYVITKVFGFVTRMIAVFVTKRPYRFRLCSFDRYIYNKLLKISLPAFLEQFLVCFCFLGSQSITSELGNATVSGISVADTVINLPYCINQGFESGTITQLGEQLGAANYEHARKIAHGNKLLSMGISYAAVAVVMVFAPYIMGLLTTSAEVAAAGVVILRLQIICAMLVAYFQYVQGIFKAIEHVFTPMIASLCGSWMIRIPLAYLLVRVFHLGLIGFFASFVCDYAFRCGLYHFTLRRIPWYRTPASQNNNT